VLVDTGLNTVRSHTADRFDFGANWTAFLAVVDDRRILEAETSLRRMLGIDTLRGRTFLDIGCGSGLFSLAARRLGAQVVSFDVDPLSVACAEELRRRYLPENTGWRIEQGSVLDASYMRSLGSFDVVYSWGVLHHTGEMWRAIERACGAVRTGGYLLIAIYNDQGRKSVWWRRVKQIYNALPAAVRPLYLFVFALAFECGAVCTAIARFQPSRLWRRWTRYHTVRGMSRWHDLVDWIGGYPFEVSTPQAVLDFCHQRGFATHRLHTCDGRMGCNEFVFVRNV